MRDVLASQCLSVDPLGVRRIEDRRGARAGGRGEGRDLPHVIRRLGVKGGIGYAYEYAGPVIESMSMEGRMTVCNMAIEGGARVGYVNPDQTTFDYLRGREYAPDENVWDRAVAHWRSMASDPGAEYDDVVRMDGADIAPTVTWGITPGQSVGVGEPLPAVEEFDEADRATVERAYATWTFAPARR